jgi:hypothetical protein
MENGNIIGLTWFFVLYVYPFINKNKFITYNHSLSTDRFILLNQMKWILMLDKEKK